MDRFSKTFYLKLLICLLLILFINNLVGDRWRQVKSDDNLPWWEKMAYVINDTSQPSDGQTEILYTSADDFNQAIRSYPLNLAINEQLNSRIPHLTIQLPPDDIVWNLEQGGLNRIEMIVNTSESIEHVTIDRSTLIDDYGLTGRVFHMGEQIYELFIHTGDIHLKTWQNPDIFATYLIDAMQLTQSIEAGQLDTQVYVTVRAYPTIRNGEDYIRLLVVANFIYE